MARRLVRLYIRASNNYPKVTAAVTGLVLAGGGDIVAQKGVEGKEHIDWRRTLALGAASAVYASQVYVPFLRISTARLGEGTARSVMAKTAIDNFVLSPFIYLPWFYLSTEWAQGRGVASGAEQLRSRFVPSLGPLWAMWIPGQIINFWLVPVQLRIAFLYGVEACWAVVISMVSQQRLEGEGEAKGEGESEEDKSAAQGDDSEGGKSTAS